MSTKAVIILTGVVITLYNHMFTMAMSNYESGEDFSIFGSLVTYALLIIPIIAFVILGIGIFYFIKGGSFNAVHERKRKVVKMKKK